MTFDEWAAQAWADGTHTVRDWPLDDLHPLRHGPLGCRFQTQGGVVTACSFLVQDAHRGDEKLLEVRDCQQGLAHIDRHGWLTAPFAETLYARIVEDMLGMAVSERVQALRELALSLNRAAVDALWEYLDASCAGTSSESLDRREWALGCLERLTGARLHTTYARIGGVAADIDEALLDELSQDDGLASAAGRVRTATGAISQALPKVLRLPAGDCYAEIETPHGVLGMWVVGHGDRTPLRVHLRTAGFRSLARLEHDAVGLPVTSFLQRLARTRLVPGEVAR